MSHGTLFKKKTQEGDRHAASPSNPLLSGGRHKKEWIFFFCSLNILYIYDIIIVDTQFILLFTWNIPKKERKKKNV